MLEGSAAEVKAYALSDTQLRCAFSKDIPLVDRICETRVLFGHTELLPPSGATEILREICRQLSGMYKELQEVLVEERTFLTVTVNHSEAFDHALRFVVMAGQPFKARVNFDRNALLGVIT